MASARRDIGALLAATGALAGEDDDLVECLERSAVGVYVVDVRGVIVWINPAMCAALGRRAGDCLGRPAAELHDEPAVFADVWSRLRAGELVRERPARLRGAAGALPVVLSGRPTRDRRGDLVGARFCARVPAELRDPAQALLDQAPLGVLRLRPDGTILAVNRATCELLGRPGVDLIGRDVFALTYPDDREFDQDKYAQLCAGQTSSYTLTKRMLRGDGSAVWVHVNAGAVRGPADEPLFFVALLEDVDASHRAEERRRERERQYEALTRLSPVGIFLGEADEAGGDCVFVNDEWTRITGRTLPEARGAGWRRALHPEDAARVIGACRHALATGQPYSGEWRLLRPDGATVWVLGHFARARDTAARKLFVGTLTDISDRVRAELDRSRLAAIVESAADALFLLDPDGTPVIWNSGAERLLGRDAAAIRGRPIVDLVPGWRGEVTACLRRVLAGEVVGEVEAELQRDDGAALAVTIAASPVHDAGGGISGVSLIVHDVSRLKAIEQALRTSEERFRSLVEAIAQIVWSTDAEGRIVEDSPSWRAFTGQTFAQMRGHGWSDAVAPEERAAVLDRWRRFVAAPRPATTEFRLRRADGTYADIQVRAVPLRGPSGVVREWVGVSVDVSEQRRIERQGEALVADLRRAMHYQEMFMAVLSHDLRSPLAAILMATGLGLRRCNDERVRRVLRQISSSGQRMLRMIEQLLDVSRIRAAGGLDIRPTQADLAEICATIADEVQQANPDAQLALDIRGETCGTWDVDRLSQLASNLIGNAIQHAEGGPAASVLVDGRDPDAVRFVVHNRGVIAPELLRSIFDPFQRAASAKTAGLGLGLYITEQIALAHGGAVAVESTSAGGTYFRVELPRHPAPATLSPPRAEPGPGAAEPRGDVRG
jgi:PAS domain S-box-containing protein